MDIVERLRVLHDDSENWSEYGQYDMKRIAEAADTIEALQAQVKDYQDACHQKQEILDSQKVQIVELTIERDRFVAMCDALLAHCGKEQGECSECSKIVCPSGDPYHFHHDGCPSCAGAR